MRWRHFQRLSERYILVKGYDDEDDPDELKKGAVGWDDVVLTALFVLQMCFNCCKHAYRSCPPRRSGITESRFSCGCFMDEVGVSRHLPQRRSHPAGVQAI